MTKVLVTGAAGFVGFHLCKALLGEGYYVIGIDNMSDNYYDVALKYDRLERCKLPDFLFYNMDTQFDSMHALFTIQQPDIVIHLAACASITYCDTHIEDCLLNNNNATLNLLNCCKDTKSVQRIIYPLSAGNESAYVTSKQLAWDAIYCYGQAYNISVTGLRFSTLYGEWGRPDMVIWKFVENILDGKPIIIYGENSTREYTHINDAIQAFKIVMGATVKPAFIYEASFGKSVSLKTLINLIERYTGCAAKIDIKEPPMGYARHVVMDNAPIRQLGFNPRVDINDGVKQFIDWYKQYKNVI